MRPQVHTLEHVGEWRVSIRADSVEHVFTELARVIAHRGGRAQGTYGAWEPVRLEAHDCVALLVDWANELIGRSEVAGRAFDNVRSLEIVGCPNTSPRSTCRLHGEIRSRAVSAWRSPIKAATYHGAALDRRDSRWEAAILFDI